MAVLLYYKKTRCPVVQSFVKRGPPSTSYLAAFYCGLESIGGFIFPGRLEAQKYSITMSSKTPQAKRKQVPAKRRPKRAAPRPSRPAQNPKMESVNIDAHRSRTVGPVDDFFRLSDCGRKYATALTNPFGMVDGRMTAENADRSEDGSHACIPSFPPLKSRRLKSFMSGTFYGGSDGYGSISFAPRRLANNYPLFMDWAPILATGPAAADTGRFPPTLDTHVAVPPVYNQFSLNTDYTTTACVVVNNVGIKSRVVSAGLRIRYVGAELTRAGIIHAIEEPDHASIAGFTSAVVGGFESSFRSPVDREWTSLVYTPVEGPDFEYLLDWASNSSGAPPNTYPHFMGFLLEGVPPGSAFEFEAVVLTEVNGRGVRDLTESESDPLGFASVLNTISPTRQANLNMQGPRVTQNDMGKAVVALTGASNMRGIVQTVGNVANLAKAVSAFM